MNKIYRLVWNRARKQIEVASELAHGNRGGDASAQCTTGSLLVLKPLVLAVLASGGLAWAGQASAQTANCTYKNASGGTVQCGYGTVVSGSDAVAVGDGAKSYGSQAVALGGGAQAGVSGGTTNQSTAVGGNVGATGDQATALGNNAQAAGNSSVAIGGDDLDKVAGTTYTAVVNGKTVTTTGAQLFTNLTGSKAIGVGIYHTPTAGDGSVALGPQAMAGGTFTGSDPSGTFAQNGVFDIAIGAQAKAAGFSSIALGTGAQATADTSFAIGPNAQASSPLTIAFGVSAMANAANAVAIGTGGTSAATYTQATGAGATAIGGNAVAGAKASGPDAIAIGGQTSSSGQSSIAIGRGTSVSANYGIALGDGTVSGTTGRNVAIGSAGTTANAGSSAGGAVAIGLGQSATGDGAVAIGDPNTVNGTGAVAMGANNVAAGNTAGTSAANGAVAIGNSNQAIGQGSVALGNSSKASMAGSLALGDTATASSAGGVALGSTSTAANANDVALGAGSTTAAPSSGPYTVNGGSIAATSDTNGVVSVGAAGKERQIQNVAAGTLSATSTNAVNGSQLYAVGASLNNLGSATASALGGGATYSTTTGTISAPSYVTYNTDGTTASNPSVASAINAINAQGIKYFHANSAKADSQANGTDSVAVGPQSVASGTQSMALGTAAQATNTQSVAAGFQSTAAGFGSIAMGNGAQTAAAATGGTAIGNEAVASNQFATAIGQSAAAGAQSLAAGVLSSASSGLSVALGFKAAANNANDVALGANSTTSAPSSGSYTINGGSIAATRDINGVVSVGAVGSERQIQNVAAGTVSAASTDAVNGSQLYAVGRQVNTNAATLGNLGSSVASGLGGTSSYDPSTGKVTTGLNVGGNTYTNVNDAVNAVNATASKGWNLSANGGTATNVAPGGTVDVSQGASGNIKVTQNGANLAIDTNPNLTATSVTTGNTVLGNAGVTVSGGANPVSLTNAGLNNGGNKITNVADGTANTDAVNVGQLNRVAATANNSVQYDDANKDKVTLGGTASTDGGVTNGTTITNVHQGALSATSTDAVNGAQLYATNQNVATNTTNLQNLGSSVASGLGGTSSYDPSTGKVTTGLNVGGNTYTNVNDAVNAVNATASKGWNLSANGGTATNVAPGGTVDVSQGASGNIKVTQNGTNLAIDTNPNLTATSVTTGNTVLDNAGVTVSGGANGPVSLTNAGLNNGGNKITNVANGTSATDAVNLSQLQAVQQTADNAVQYDDASKGKVTLGGTASTDGGVTNGTTITNVHQGALSATSTDAVNGAQLYATNQNLSTLGTYVSMLQQDALQWNPVLGAYDASHGSGTPQKISNVAAGALSATSTDAVNGSQLYTTNQRVTSIENNIGSITNGSAGMFQVSQDHNAPPPSPTGTNSAAGGANAVASGNSALAVGNGSTAAGNASTALGSGATASGNGSTAIGQGASATADGSVALGQGASDGGRGAESYIGKYSGVTNNSSGTVSVGNAATGETRTISNVADGKEATDAVNLRQLDGAVADAKNYTDTQISNVANSVNNGAAGMFQVSQDHNNPTPTASGKDSTAGGAGAVASGDHSVALGNNSAAAGANSTALGNGSSAQADNAVALGAGSVADRANTVSVGAAGQERQITNVAAGTQGTDAVNVNQLKASQNGGVRYDTNADGSTNYNSVAMGNGNSSGPVAVHNVAAGTAPTDAVNVNQFNTGIANAVGQANQYTDSRVDQLQSDVSKFRRDADAGTAAAMAMAGLPQAYLPGKSMVAVGASTYRGTSALAIGASTISDNGHWVLKISGSTTSRGSAGVTGGVGYQW